MSEFLQSQPLPAADRVSFLAGYFGKSFLTLIIITTEGMSRTEQLIYDPVSRQSSLRPHTLVALIIIVREGMSRTTHLRSGTEAAMQH